MIYHVQIKVMPIKELLDPQGKAVLGAVQNLGVSAIKDVRVGKHISLEVDAADEESAKAAATEACEKLLANPVMEYFEIESLHP